jgi:methylmalonyl-CoA mutase, N-terminal domain
MGGIIPAIQSGYVQRECTKSAYEWQKRVESGEEVVVGVNAFTDPSELEVTTARLVPYPYDPKKREAAEEKQIINLLTLKRNRDNAAVAASLKRLKEAAQDENVNLIPTLIENVKTYATLGEICDVLRGVFGEYQFGEKR